MVKEERIFPRPWSNDEIELLKKLYAEKPTEELAKQLGRSPAMVRAKANSIGLRRSRIDFGEL